LLRELEQQALNNYSFFFSHLTLILNNQQIMHAAIPPIPLGYTYSIRQRIQQFQYFKNKYDTSQKQDDSMDLFNVSIIAVCKY
jgi:hypothetical protein